MKRFFLWSIIFLSASSLFPQTQPQEVTVTNISVPVRVFDGDEFVDHLSITDFEVYEDGILQTVDALYLVNQNDVDRSESEKGNRPQLSRHFYFIFQVTGYESRYKDVADIFFQEIYRPGDLVTIMTPLGNYTLSAKALQIKSQEDLSRDMQSVIRKDATSGSSSYNSLIKDLTRLVRSITAVGGVDQQAMAVDIDSESMQTGFDENSLGFLLNTYRSTLQNLESMRIADESKFLDFALRMKIEPGQKQVFFFYEREFRPEISTQTMSSMMQRYQDQPTILSDIQDLFQFYQRDMALDTGKLNQAFADSSALFNFIFINKDPGNFSGISMREQSEDVFRTFTEIARATGGVIDNSQNPAAAFRKASLVSGHYYLLYYTPKLKQDDRTFRTIQVQVKNKEFTIAHRRGYFIQ